MMKTLARFFPSRRWLFLPPLLIGVATVAFLGSSRQELKRIDATETATPLQVVQVQRTLVAAEATGFGTAQPLRLWSATAEVGGQIVETHPRLRSGVFVEPGELLFRIDSSDYQLRVGQRKAELAQTQAQLRQLKLTWEADEESLKIQSSLLKVRQGDVERLRQLQTRAAASQSELDNAMAALLQQSQTVQNLRSALATYPAQVASAEASIDLADARLAEAQRDISRTTVVAPFGGLLSGVSIEPGQYVAPNERLFQLFDTASIEIEAQFSIAQLGRIFGSEKQRQSGRRVENDSESNAPETGSMAEQLTRSNPPANGFAEGVAASVALRSGDLTMHYPARTVRVMESLDEQTRTLGIVVRVDNESSPDRGQPFSLRPGAYCEVILNAESPIDAFLVPRTSVDAGVVLVVDEDRRLRRRRVEVAFALREQFAITSGLMEGDLVVINPPPVAIEGAAIAPLLAGESVPAIVPTLVRDERGENP